MPKVDEVPILDLSHRRRSAPAPVACASISSRGAAVGVLQLG